MNVLIILASFGALFLLIEISKRKFKLNPEISRKIAHLLTALASAALPFFAAFSDIAIAAAFFVPIMLISKFNNLFSAVHSVQRRTLGEIYFPAAVGLMATLFPLILPYTFGLAVLGISDTTASSVGRRFGKHGYKILGVNKTYLGSAAFAVTTFLVGLSIFSIGSIPLAQSAMMATLSAVVLTLVEGVSPYGTDNLSVPLAAGALIVLLS